MSWFELDHERSSLSQYLENNFSDTLSNVQALLPGVLEMYVYLEDPLSSQLQVVGHNVECTK